MAASAMFEGELLRKAIDLGRDQANALACAVALLPTATMRRFRLRAASITACEQS